MQLQQTVIDGLEHRLDVMHYRAIMSKVNIITIEMMVGYLHHQMSQLVALVVFYFDLWYMVELGKFMKIFLCSEEGKVR